MKEEIYVCGYVLGRCLNSALNVKVLLSAKPMGEELKGLRKRHPLLCCPATRAGAHFRNASHLAAASLAASKSKSKTFPLFVLFLH